MERIEGAIPIVLKVRASISISGGGSKRRGVSVSELLQQLLDGKLKVVILSDHDKKGALPNG